jgi:hypothetical protein
LVAVTVTVKADGCKPTRVYAPEASVVVDLPAFGPSTMDNVAPEMTVAELPTESHANTHIPVTLPLSENVEGVVGVGEGPIEVPLLPPQAAEMITANIRGQWGSP